jgi:hypothetical protein
VLLRQMVEDGAPLNTITRALKRSRDAVETKIYRLKLKLVSAKPVRLEPLRLDQCAWIDGHRPNWTRCQECAWKHSAWCYTHYRRVYVRPQSRLVLA